VIVHGSVMQFAPAVNVPAGNMLFFVPGPAPALSTPLSMIAIVIPAPLIAGNASCTVFGENVPLAETRTAGVLTSSIPCDGTSHSTIATSGRSAIERSSDTGTCSTTAKVTMLLM
jgi:hypothetical protein